MGTTIHPHTSPMCTLSGNNEIILSVQPLTPPVLPDVYDAARWPALNTMNWCAEKFLPLRGALRSGRGAALMPAQAR